MLFFAKHDGLVTEDDYDDRSWTSSGATISDAKEAAEDVLGKSLLWSEEIPGLRWHGYSLESDEVLVRKAIVLAEDAVAPEAK